MLRIDHFRGFDEYYAIPYGDATAEFGEWEKGPGIELFETLENQMGKLPILAEDLGFLTDSVRKLLADSGFPWIPDSFCIKACKRFRFSGYESGTVCI